MQLMAQLILKQDKERSLYRRHPWIFEGSIARMNGQARSGERDTPAPPRALLERRCGRFQVASAAGMLLGEQDQFLLAPQHVGCTHVLLGLARQLLAFPSSFAGGIDSCAACQAGAAHPGNSSLHSTQAYLPQP